MALLHLKNLISIFQRKAFIQLLGVRTGQIQKRAAVQAKVQAKLDAYKATVEAAKAATEEA